MLTDFQTSYAWTLHSPFQHFESSGINLMSDSQYNGQTRVQVLLEYLQEREMDLEDLGSVRRIKLEQCIQLCQFETDANQVCWQACFIVRPFVLGSRLKTPVLFKIFQPNCHIKWFDWLKKLRVFIWQSNLLIRHDRFLNNLAVLLKST